MDEILKQLATLVIDSTALDYVETITLEGDTNDYIHGFKIYYDDTWRAYNARYWRSTWVADNKTHRMYKESQITPDDLTKLLQWRNNGDITIVPFITHERKRIFPKDPNKGKMIDL